MSEAMDLEVISSVGDLQLWDATIEIDQPTRVVEVMFADEVRLPAVIVTQRGAPLGLLSRKVLLSALSRPLGRDIYIKRPIREMQDEMDRDPLILDHDIPIAAAVDRALSRPPASAYEPVLVASPSRAHRILAIDLLLRVQSALLGTAIAAKDKLIDEVQRTAAELRHTLDVLEEARDRLVRSEKMAALGQLVAGVAHEINTPIGVALTSATHLGERTEEFTRNFQEGRMKRTDLQSYVDLAAQSTNLLRFNIQRAAQLIQSFKQVAVDQVSEQRRAFDVKDYLEQLTASLRPEARKLGHTIMLDCSEGIEMASYPGALGQAISNLIANAMVHAYPEGTAGQILVTARRDGDQVTIAVSDTGMGIAEENLARIYDPFFTTRRGAGGSGLGLHIVFNIVTENLHGHIDCTSIVSKGTTFTITAPLDYPE
jgi:signal transduction histidine kinase